MKEIEFDNNKSEGVKEISEEIQNLLTKHYKGDPNHHVYPRLGDPKLDSIVLPLLVHGKKVVIEIKSK